MNRPAARLWAGALVLGAASILVAGPVRLAVEPASKTSPRGFVESVPSASTDARADNRWNDSFHPADLPTRQAVQTAAGGYDGAVGGERPRGTPPAVPLPPAVWPAAVTLGAVAIASVFKQHRRR